MLVFTLEAVIQKPVYYLIPCFMYICTCFFIECKLCHVNYSNWGEPEQVPRLCDEWQFVCHCIYVYIVWWLRNHRKLGIATRFLICHINLRVKNGVVLKHIRLSHAKRFVCCTLTIRYNIYGMVGRSIASISDLGIFTSGRIYRQLTSLPYDIYYTYIYIYCTFCCIVLVDATKWLSFANSVIFTAESFT